MSLRDVPQPGAIPASSCLSEDALDPGTTKHFEGAFTQGSGYMHIRGCHEEGLAAAPQAETYMRLPANVTLEKPRHPRSKRGTYVPGVTGRHPLLREELVNLPWLLELTVRANEEPLDMDACRIQDYHRVLDLRDAVLWRTFTWHTRSGAVLRASYRRYVSRARANICVQEVEYLCRTGETALRVESGIDARVRTNGYDHLAQVRSAVEGGSAGATGRSGSRGRVEATTDTGDLVALCTEAHASTGAFRPATDGTAVEGASTAGVNRRPVSVLDVRLQEGQRLRILKLGAVATSRDLATPSGGVVGRASAGGTPAAAADAALDAAFAASEALYAEHAAAWAEMWRQSAVAIGGDERTQAALNFSLYHLLRAGNPLDGRVAVCAKGSAGEAYFGHFFWDSEIYLLPFFLYTRPAAARALLEFRKATLPGARRNAASYGYAGARFPWESSVTGDEQCPNWQYADFEVHVTADIAHAIRHYTAATGDQAFLDSAAELLVETARYWLSRVERRPDGSVNLNGVMGPDEYLCSTNNNAYTNVMVKRALDVTVETVEGMARRHPARHAVLAERLGVTDAELKDFAAVAAALPVRRRADGALLQCDGFDELETVDFASVWKDRGKPFGHFISQERNYRSKALKQADALMLSYLFPSEYGGETLRAGYDYYVPYTTHDSSLSCVIHSILAGRLGRHQEAWDFFERALSIDLDPVGGGAAEGIHIANCGGIWQAVVMGFAGMAWAYESDTLACDPHLPGHWTSLDFPVCWRGRRHAVHIDRTGVTIKEEHT